MVKKNTKKTVAQSTTRKIVERGLVGLLDGVENISSVRGSSDVERFMASFSMKRYRTRFDLEYDLTDATRIDHLILSDRDRDRNPRLIDEDLRPLRTRIENLFPGSEFLGLRDMNDYTWFLPIARVAAYSINQFGY